MYGEILHLMDRNVYIVMKDDSVECYSNLTKAVRKTPLIEYFPVYRQLVKNGIAENNGYRIINRKLI